MCMTVLSVIFHAVIKVQVGKFEKKGKSVFLIFMHSSVPLFGWWGFTEEVVDVLDACNHAVVDGDAPCPLHLFWSICLVNYASRTPHEHCIGIEGP